MPSGTLLTLELYRRRWDVRPRRLVLGRLARLLAGIEADTSQLLIVAAAIVADRKVLVARRNHPARWPAAGSSRAARPSAARRVEWAIVRECAEELGCRIEVEGELGRHRLDERGALVLVRARVGRGLAGSGRAGTQRAALAAAAEFDAWTGSTPTGNSCRT